jgi:D-alanine-D-alanine ligase
MSLRPIILFGGVSEERMVSVASAQNIAGQLPEAALWFVDRQGALHEVSPPELAAHRDPFTTPFVPAHAPFAGSLEAALGLLPLTCVVIALHGTEGEDGTIQDLFERHCIAFTGAGAAASRLAFDKIATKRAAAAAHLPVAQDLSVHAPRSPEGQAALRAFAAQHPRLVLKPTANGSSVGLFIVNTPADLEKALTALPDGTPYLAEAFIEGREITVGVRERQDGTLEAFPCSEVRVLEGRQFDYEGKYLGKGVQELTPAPLDPEQTSRCQQLALELHRLTGCRGYSRTDMILTPQGPILLEINTLPGLSKASFVPQQLHAMGETLRTFFLGQMELAKNRR